MRCIFFTFSFTFFSVKFFSVKLFFNIKLFFHMKTFFLYIMFILLKKQIFFQIFFFNLVLQQMNNHRISPLCYKRTVWAKHPSCLASNNEYQLNLIVTTAMYDFGDVIILRGGDIKRKFHVSCISMICKRNILPLC